MLTIHQERLADAAERDQQRRHWQGVITALVAAMTETRHPTLISGEDHAGDPSGGVEGLG